MHQDSLKDLSNSKDRYKLFLMVCKPQEKASCIAALKCQNIQAVDIGYELAGFTSGLSSLKYLTIEGSEFLKELLHTRKSMVKGQGNDIIAMHNVGIMLEPDFGLDAARWIQEFSKNVSTLIIWENQVVDNQVLHWSTQNHLRTLNFRNTPFKRFTHEV